MALNSMILDIVLTSMGIPLSLALGENDESFIDSGAVYVFEPHAADTNNWSQVAMLQPDDVDVDDSFGHSLAVLGNRLIIGASLDDDRGLTSGSVYVFGRHRGGQWSQDAKLTAPDGSAGDEFW